MTTGRAVGHLRPLLAAPSPSQIRWISETLMGRFGWDAAWSDPIIERMWRKERSGNHFVQVAAPECDPIVLKFLSPAEMDHGDVGAVAAAMNDLAAILAGYRSLAAISPRSVGWLDDPPVVASQSVFGTRFTEFLRDPDHPAWHTGITSTWVENAGAALAAWHDTGLDLRGGRDAALAATVSTMRRLRLGKSQTRALADYVQAQPQMIARRYRDFGPGNLLGISDGSIAVLDPPVQPELAARQRDIADFLVGVEMNLAGRAVEGVAGRRDPSFLRDAFVRGYRELSGVDPLEGCGSGLLALFESRRSLGVARKRATGRPGGDLSLRRRWLSAWWAARHGVARRRAVGRIAKRC